MAGSFIIEQEKPLKYHTKAAIHAESTKIMSWQHPMYRKCIGAGNEPVSAIQDGGPEVDGDLFSALDQMLYAKYGNASGHENVSCSKIFYHETYFLDTIEFNV